MSDAIPFVSLTVGTEAGDGVICNAIPFDSLAADPDPDRAIRRWDRGTHPEPDHDPDRDPAVRRIPIAPRAPPDPDPDPASGAPYSLFFTC